MATARPSVAASLAAPPAPPLAAPKPPPTPAQALAELAGVYPTPARAPQPLPPAPPAPAAAPAPKPPPAPAAATAERQGEVMSAAAARAVAPEPVLEKGPLPKVDAPSEPPLARGMMGEAPLDNEPGASSQPPSAHSPEPAFVAQPRSMAVRSAEISVEDVHAVPGGAFAQLGAWIVDAVVLGLLFALYVFAAQLIAGRIPASEETGLDWFIERAYAWRGVLLPGTALLAALCFCYTSLFHTLGGRTLGKRLFGLTVVDDSGLPPGLARSALRSVCAFLSAALFMMGFVLVLFDPRKQALHDKLAHTFVVRLAG